MARKKAPTFDRAIVRVLVSFNNLHKGDEADVPWSDRVAAWVALGFVEVVPGGTDPAGPGGAEPDDDEREPVGAEGSEPTGSEPSPGFGESPYGSSA